jgi:hypothetical protein
MARRVRRVLRIVTAIALPVLLLVTLESGVATANPVLAGTVTCNPAGGAWSGGAAVVTFSPPLVNGGTSPTEKMVVGGMFSVKFGGASPCTAPALTPPTVDGALKGVLTFHIPDANSCSTVFSGSPIVPIHSSKFKMKWISPNGAPTLWKRPVPFSVVGASGMTNITITGGTLTGSFASYPTPTAILRDTSWTAAIIGAACASGGVSSLTLAKSSGAW